MVSVDCYCVSRWTSIFSCLDQHEENISKYLQWQKLARTNTCVVNFNIYNVHSLPSLWNSCLSNASLTELRISFLLLCGPCREKLYTTQNYIRTILMNIMNSGFASIFSDRHLGQFTWVTDSYCIKINKDKTFEYVILGDK